MHKSFPRHASIDSESQQMSGSNAQMSRIRKRSSVSRSIDRSTSLNWVYLVQYGWLCIKVCKVMQTFDEFAYVSHTCRGKVCYYFYYLSKLFATESFFRTTESRLYGRLLVDRRRPGQNFAKYYTIFGQGVSKYL